jgi:glucose-6-phosphate isomerase
MVKIGIEGLGGFIESGGFDGLSERAHRAADALRSGGAPGWAKLPGEYGERAGGELKDAARAIAAESEALVVIGVGGSYLGARAAIEYIRSPEYNMLATDTPKVFFAGNDLSAEHAERVMALLAGRDFSVSIVSKSGTTIETSIAFRLFMSLLEARYGRRGAARRVYVTTGAGTALEEFARERGCARFVIPDDVGGRYSALTAVGLLPAAVAGCDIDGIMAGARAEAESGAHTEAVYAAVRQALYAAGRKIEILGVFEPTMQYLGEWWKQIFGESEGKGGRGIFPCAAQFTADLHSLGQYIQQGERTLMETFLTVDKSRSSLRTPRAGPFGDGLDAIASRGLDELNAAAARAVRDAHIEGGVPVTELRVPEISAGSFGALVYFFESACVISSGLSGVAPYGQPGVEAYKRKLKAILQL